MDSLELVGVIAVSFVPFLVSIGAVLLGGVPRKWPFLCYAFSLLAGFLAGKDFGLLLWSSSWIMAWVFAGIALRARGDRSIRTSSPAEAEGAEVAFGPPDDESSRRASGSNDLKVG